MEDANLQLAIDAMNQCAHDMVEHHGKCSKSNKDTFCTLAVQASNLCYLLERYAEQLQEVTNG